MSEHENLLVLYRIVNRKYNAAKKWDNENGKGKERAYGWMLRQLDLILEGRNIVEAKHSDSQVYDKPDFFDLVNSPRKEPHDIQCRHYCRNNDGEYCGIGADMSYCSRHCAWRS